MLEEFAPEVIIVAGAGAILVLGIMVVVWFLSTREGGGSKAVHSQEAAAAALIVTKAGGKKKKPYSPRRKKEVHRDTNSTDEEEDEQPRKSILKAPGGESPEEDGSTSKHANLHVEFKMDGSPPRDEDRSSHTSPPTPHPSATRKAPVLSFADSDQAEGTTDEATTKKHTSPKGQEAKPPAPGDTKPSSGSHQKTTAAQKHVATPGQSSGHKKKTKSKQTAASFGECQTVASGVVQCRLNPPSIVPDQ